MLYHHIDTIPRVYLHAKVLPHSGLRLFWRNPCCTQTTVKGVLHGRFHDCLALKNCCYCRLYSGVAEANAVTYLSYLESSLPSKIENFRVIPVSNYCMITECAHYPIPILVRFRFQGSHFSGLTKFHDFSMIFPVFFQENSRYISNNI